MYKIAIIGDRESVLGFMALGFSVFEAETAAAAAETLHRVAATGEYAVIFLVENYAAQLEADMVRYKDAPLPAVTVIGVTTFLLSAVGLKVGNVFGLRYKSRAELAGGVILILIGLKTLLEHLGWLPF